MIGSMPVNTTSSYRFSSCLHINVGELISIQEGLELESIVSACGNTATEPAGKFGLVDTGLAGNFGLRQAKRRVAQGLDDFNDGLHNQIMHHYIVFLCNESLLIRA